MLLAHSALWGSKEEVVTGVPVDAPAFRVVAPWENGKPIPHRFTCDGEDVNPPLEFPDLPPQTKHLAVLMEDPDASDGPWVHWLWWDGAPEEVAVASEPGISGKNSWGRIGYGGPCPPVGSHRYFFHVYALSAPLGLPAGSDRHAFAAALKGKAIGHGTVMGKYAR